jgi:putative ABC transport system substrate-binding protein
MAGVGAAAWPLAARAQQPMRRVGILWPFSEDDPVRKAWHAGFIQGLAERGWTAGHNVRIDVRWNLRTPEQAQAFGRELIELKPGRDSGGPERARL